MNSDEPKSKSKKRDFIDDCRDNFDRDSTPFKLGKLYCLWYNSSYKPRIVLGPDWGFSLIEIFIINGISGFFIGSIDRKSHSWLFMIGLITLLI